jgi:hypothetical protein
MAARACFHAVTIDLGAVGILPPSPLVAGVDYCQQARGGGEATGLDDASEHHNIVEIEHCIHYWDDASQLWSIMNQCHKS